MGMFLANRVISVPVPSAAASSVDCPVLTVESGAEYEVVEVIEAHAVAGNDAGSVTADLKKSDSGTAPSGGTSVLASTFNLKSTANTPVTKTAANGGLSSSAVTRRLTAGQTLAIDFTGTLTTLAGMCFTIVLKPLRRSTNR